MATEETGKAEALVDEHAEAPAEVVEAIRRAGYDPVWKDFDLAF